MVWVILPIIVVVAIIAGYWFIKMKNKNVGNNISSSGQAISGPTREGAIQLPNQNSNLNSLSGNDQTAAGAESPEDKRSNEQPDEAFRQQTIAYINQNLNKLATPPKNDQWDTPTFYFVGNSIVYVDLYAMDTDLGGAELLYKVEKDSSGIKLTELARKKETEDDFILTSGKDDYADYYMEEYDLNDTTNKWEKTDEFSSADNTSEGDSVIDADLNDNSGQKVLP